MEIRVVSRTFANDLRTRYTNSAGPVSVIAICSRKIRTTPCINSSSFFKRILAIFQVFGEPKGLTSVELVMMQLLQVCWRCPDCRSLLGEPLSLESDLENIHKHNLVYQQFTPRLADVVYLLESHLDTISSNKQHETAK